MTTVLPAPPPPRHRSEAPASRRPAAPNAPAGQGGRGRSDRVLLLIPLAAASVATAIPAILPIFNGGGVGALLLAAFLPAVLAVGLFAGVAARRGRPVPLPLRFVVYLGVGAALLATLPGDALSGLASGGARLVTGALPSLASGPEFGIAVAATYLASVIAVEVVCVGRGVMAAVVPGAVLLVGALLIGTGGLPQPRWAGALYVGAAALVALVHQLSPDTAASRAAQAIRALIGVAIGVAVAIFALPLAGVLPGVHARQPYSLRAAVAPAPTPVDQLSLLATYSSTYDAPPEPVFTAKVTGADAQSLYWRLATFDQFDGLEWSSSEVFQRAGTRLPVGPSLSVGTTTVHAVIHPESLPGYLPAPDRPQEVSISGLGVSVGSGELVLPAGLNLPEEIRVTSVIPAPTKDDFVVSAATPGPTNPGAPPIPSDLTSLARTLEASSSPNPFARLTALSDYLTSSKFRLHPPGNSPIGAGYYQVTQLLRTHSGSTEQYAAAFAILARAMGFHARLAVGYMGGTSQADGSVAFTTRNLRVWPEVELAGIGWQPLPADPSGIGLGTGSGGPQPSPTTTVPHGSSPPTTAAHGSTGPPAATSPPTTSSPLGEALQQQREINKAPKPSPAPSGSGSPSGVPGSVPTVAQGGGLPHWVWAVIGACVAVALGLGGLVGAKAIRRRRQRRRTDPAARLAGAWEHTLDRLAEHQLHVPASLTAPEVADRAAPSIGAAAAPLQDLAGAVDAARYDRRRGPASSTVEQAWAVARQVDDALRSGASVRARIRAALSLAPFTR